MQLCMYLHTHTYKRGHACTPLNAFSYTFHTHGYTHVQSHRVCICTFIKTPTRADMHLHGVYTRNMRNYPPARICIQTLKAHVHWHAYAEEYTGLWTYRHIHVNCSGAQAWTPTRTHLIIHTGTLTTMWNHRKSYIRNTPVHKIRRRCQHTIQIHSCIEQHA